MIKHIWSVLCSKSTIDKDTNNASLFEVLEQLSFTVSGPDAEKVKKEALDKHLVAPLNFEVVTLLDRETPKGEHGAVLKSGIVDPSGKTLGSSSHEFSFPEGKPRMRVTSKFDGMPLTTSGIYRVVVMLKEAKATDYKIVAEIPLEVTVKFE